MSVINQVLLDLERRRASTAERSALPDHVRALPDGERPAPWGWIAGGVTLAVALSAGGWLWSARGGTPERTVAAPPVPRGTATAIEQVVSASAGVATESRREAAPGAAGVAPASRLSFDLSSPPAPEPPAAREPLRTERVLARMAPEDAASPREPATRPEAAVQRGGARAPAASPPPGGGIQKEVRQPSPRELADLEYRKAAALLHQRRLGEAEAGFRAALGHYPGHHAARQALVGLMLEARNPGAAEQLLQDGLALAPAQTGFAMTLARLQVERGDTAPAIATLEAGLAYAEGSAEYQAFLAALLQRQGRHEDAIGRFRAALRGRPAAGVWWLGLGVSLQAANRAAEAQDAYRRARAANDLSPELAAFAEQRLRQLQ